MFLFDIFLLLFLLVSVFEAKQRERENIVARCVWWQIGFETSLSGYRRRGKLRWDSLYFYLFYLSVINLMFILDKWYQIKNTNCLSSLWRIKRRRGKLQWDYFLCFHNVPVPCYISYSVKRHGIFNKIQIAENVENCRKCKKKLCCKKLLCSAYFPLCQVWTSFIVMVAPASS